MPGSLLLHVESGAEWGSLASLLDHARACGFDGLELAVPIGGPCPPGPEPCDPPDELETEQEIPLVIAADGLSTQVGAATTEMIELLDQARRWGAAGLNLSLPPVDQSTTRTSFRRYQEALNFAHTLLHDIRDEVESSGVALGLEAASGGFLLSPVELRELVDSVNSSAIGVCVEVDRVAAIGIPLDWIGTLGRRVRSIRFEASTLIAPEHPVSPSTTEPVLAELGAVGYRGPIIVTGFGHRNGSPAHLQQIRKRIATSYPAGT